MWKWIVALAALAAGCRGSDVGRTCNAGAQPGVTVLNSQALECDSRMCLQTAAAGAMPACTAFCESDADCEGGPRGRCGGGFVCATPMVVGPFACRRLCVCQDAMAGVAPAACVSPP